MPRPPADAVISTHPESRPFFVRLAPTVAVVYFVGASLFLLRLMAATWGGHRLRIASTSIDDPSLLKLVVDQSRQVGLRLVPTVAYCQRVAVPMAVGVLRPVILLPTSIMTGLDPEQFAAIISHELAHIRPPRPADEPDSATHRIAALLPSRRLVHQPSNEYGTRILLRRPRCLIRLRPHGLRRRAAANGRTVFAGQAGRSRRRCRFRARCPRNSRVAFSV